MMKRLEKERERKVSRSTSAGQSCDSDKNIEGKQSSAQWAGNAKFLHSTTIFEFQKSLWFPKKGGKTRGYNTRNAHAYEIATMNTKYLQVSIPDMQRPPEGQATTAIRALAIVFRWTTVSGCCDLI